MQDARQGKEQKKKRDYRHAGTFTWSLRWDTDGVCAGSDDGGGLTAWPMMDEIGIHRYGVLSLLRTSMDKTLVSV